MTKLIYLLNGPNLNLLGRREPDIYGAETLADVEASCLRAAEAAGLALRAHQSNREYELIDWIHQARDEAAGIVINPGAFTHTSIAILDALKAFDGPIFEVHISNVHQRESFRHHSYVSLAATGVIAGFGTAGYAFAVTRIGQLLAAAD
jgi:3-dehydroquinate dehydratase-2